MKKLILVISSLILICSSALYSETITGTMYYNGPGNQVDKPCKTVMDKAGFVYVTGTSYGGSSTKEDYATIKYGKNGEFLWTKRYDGPGHDLDVAADMTVDDAGNIYVTGYSRSTTSYGSEDYLTIKYSTSGTQLWTARFDGAVTDCYYYDYATAIWVDASGNVYVTGYGWNNDNTQDNYETVKYNSSGVQQWVVRYDSQWHNVDMARAIYLDQQGNVYVTGSSFWDGTTKGFDYLTVKYNNNGVQQWTARYDGPGHVDDNAYSIKVDPSGSIYVTGGSMNTTASTSVDYATVKYNQAGAQQWVTRYNGTGNGFDEARAMDLDARGMIYVTGSSKGSSTGLDYATIKYDRTTGQQLWAQRYNGPVNDTDRAWDIKAVNRPCNLPLDTLDDICFNIGIFVAGQSKGTGTSDDFVTIKYDENGVMTWVNRFNRNSTNKDVAYSIAANDKFKVMYVAGMSNNDYGVIRITDLDTMMDHVNPLGIQNGISANYPNPFNPETNILFNLAADEFVTLKIYDMLGREVTTLVNKQLGPGSHSYRWDASNNNSGVYFYRLQAGSITETKKIILVK